LRDIPGYAQAAESAGFSAIWTAETQRSPLLPGPLIAEHTDAIQFGTAIAVAFGRSPATLAHEAWDLAEASDGRFILGLGTQVRAHIQRRFGMEWPESVVTKFREQIQGIRAFWHSWQTGERLNQRGKYYKLTLMTPFFDPGPIAHPDIPIFIAGVNTGLARLAGEVADGFHVHPLHTLTYLEEVIKPAVAEGAARAGRDAASIQFLAPVFVATNDEELVFVRQQIAFYASTPSYRSVLRLHGWDSTGEALSRLAARGRWEDMPALISDEMLDAFAVTATEAELGAALHVRYQGKTQRITPYLPFIPAERDSFWASLIGAFNNAHA
jgi:probable F420-dependent oxidoreductase